MTGSAAPGANVSSGPETRTTGSPAPGGIEHKHRRLLLGGAVLLVAALIMLAVGSFRHQVGVQRADDPRSTTAQGARALAQLLTDEGVRIETTDDVEQAVQDSDASTLLVVASPDALSNEQAARIGGATYGRLLLLRPGAPALRAFGVPVDPTVPAGGPVSPGCSEPAATAAGSIVTDDFRAGYRSPARTVSVRCYPAGDGAAWLRVGGPFGQVDLVAGGVSNRVLGQDGNAAFGMNVFGAQPRIVWLMGRAAAMVTDDTSGPGLLPTWWAPMIVQSFVALVVVGIWRGRRLGPILREPIPVTVRASETVVGHGRLYARIGARDRAAEALRGGVRDRLGRAYGQRVGTGPAGAGRAGTEPAGPDHDVLALSAAIAARTGRPAVEIARLLTGPPPSSDDDLVILAHDLDRLEQEARRL